MTATADFLEKNRELLAGLKKEVEALRAQPKNPEGYYRLCGSMEAYRDFVRDFLDTLGEGKRARVEGYLSPAIFPLTEEAHKLAVAAQEIGVIPEDLAHDIGIMGVSLAFVSVQTSVWKG